MKDFLLEILSEEIPAKMQNSACENFRKIALENFTKSGIKIDEKKLKIFSTSRRIALQILDIEENQETKEVEIFGPKVDSSKKAIQGFLKSLNLEKVEDLAKIQYRGAECYFFKKEATQIQTKKLLEENVPIILQKMINSWPKLMKWQVKNNQQAKWIRPVRNILCIFGEEIVNFEFFGIQSNSQTFGHFLHSQNPISIKSAIKYEDILLQNFVIADSSKRKKEIIAQINKIKFSQNLELIDDEDSALFDEVNGLCEFPNALLGKIDEKFTNLPKDVLILTLKLNQKFFCLEDKNGNLSRNFIFISNALNLEENQDRIIKDNEKIAKARLEDALFFINEDSKIPLISRVEELKNITFHQKLGSIYERCKRIEDLAEFIAIWISHCEIGKIKHIANLCKADLTTKIVTEFPELQGKIGGFYARKQGEDEKIAKAIEEHYLPLGLNSQLPQTPLGTAIAIADKMDMIVGLFLAGQKPTSSKDPFALRRAALGIIRICLQQNIAIPFRVLINKSLKSYKPKIIDELLKENNENNEKVAIARKNLTEEIAKFFIERLKNFLKEAYQLRQDVLNSVIDDYLENFHNHKYGDIANLARKSAFVNQLVEKDENKNLIQLYKRSANVLNIEEKKDKATYQGKPNRLLLKINQEKVLLKMIRKIQKNYQQMVKQGDYKEAFRLLQILEVPLSHFFEKVIVNDENKKLRENRLLILSQIREMFLMVADFSKIELKT